MIDHERCKHNIVVKGPTAHTQQLLKRLHHATAGALLAVVAQRSQFKAARPITTFHCLLEWWRTEEAPRAPIRTPVSKASPARKAARRRRGARRTIKAQRVWAVRRNEQILEQVKERQDALHEGAGGGVSVCASCVWRALHDWTPARLKGLGRGSKLGELSWASAGRAGARAT